MTRLNRNATIGLLLTLLLITSLAFLANRPARADKPGATSLEVVPTVQQQQLIKDLLIEKRNFDAQKDGEISGAVKQLMTQLADPVTGKVGLESDKWVATTDGKDGFKFVLQSSLREPEKKPAQ